MESIKVIISKEVNIPIEDVMDNVSRKFIANYLNNNPNVISSFAEDDIRFFIKVNSTGRSLVDILSREHTLE